MPKSIKEGRKIEVRVLKVDFNDKKLKLTAKPRIVGA